MAKDNSRTMTTRSASVTERSTSQPVRNTSSGEGLGGAADGESDNSSNYSVEDSQGTNHRDLGAVFNEDDGISDSRESTVNSLTSLQLSNAAAINSRSEDLFPPAGVGLEAPISFGAGAHQQPAGPVSLGASTKAAAVSLPPGPPPSIPRHQSLLSSSATGRPPPTSRWMTI
jgi:hypothetical protein